MIIRNTCVSVLSRDETEDDVAQLNRREENLQYRAFRGNAMGGKSIPKYSQKRHHSRQGNAMIQVA